MQQSQNRRGYMGPPFGLSCERGRPLRGSEENEDGKRKDNQGTESNIG